jgi:hypothetical protein
LGRSVLELYQNDGRPRTVFDLQNRSLFKTVVTICTTCCIVKNLSEFGDASFPCVHAILGQTDSDSFPAPTTVVPVNHINQLAGFSNGE